MQSSFTTLVAFAAALGVNIHSPLARPVITPDPRDKPYSDNAWPREAKAPKKTPDDHLRMAAAQAKRDRKNRARLAA